MTRKILLVDDEEDLLMVMEARLRKMGYDVTVAQSGKEAIQKIASEPFGLVLMDCRMPGMSGQETCKIIKESPQYAKIPIVLVTASVVEATPEKQVLFHFDDHLIKPFEISQLKTVLQKFLE